MTRPKYTTVLGIKQTKTHVHMHCIHSLIHSRAHKNVPSTEMFTSVGGYAMLTPSYLKQNKMYGKSIQVIHSWNSNGPVLEAIFAKPIFDSKRVNKFGEPAAANIGMIIIGGTIGHYFEDLC